MALREREKKEGAMEFDVGETRCKRSCSVHSGGPIPRRSIKLRGVEGYRAEEK